MLWYVVINASLGNLVVARGTVAERMADLNPKVVPLGGTERRVRLRITAETESDAAEQCLTRLRTAFADWDGLRGGGGIDLSSATVGYVSTDEPSPDEWDNLT